MIWSLWQDKQKTVRALKIGWKGFLRILPPFLQVLILVSFALFLIPETLITTYLGANSGLMGIFVGGLLGSISIIPGFIAYPLAAVLIRNGVGYMAVSSFVTTLMMVGVLTYPLEKAYFGVRITLLRNALSFIIAIIIAIIIGIIYGESL